MSNIPNTSLYPPLVEYHDSLTIEELKNLALQIRRDVIDIAEHSGTRSGHLGGEMSVADILAVLYGSFVRLDPNNPHWEGRDIVILSKGHNSAAQYAALAFRGVLDRKLLFNDMNKADCILQEHSNTDIPGIEAPTGSLGMGLAAGAGFAWAFKQQNKNNKVYVILGDGECTEGQVWEAALFANAHGLDNLIAIVDYNKYIITGNIEETMRMEPMAGKWSAFGWDTVSVDGHSVEELKGSLERAVENKESPGKPKMIVANTLKGYPISFMMDDPLTFHSAHLTDETYKRSMEELK